MANPDLLNSANRADYEALLSIGVDPEEAFETVMARQQAQDAAKSTLTEEAETNRLIREGRQDELPPELLDVLDIQRPGDTFKPFSEFLPGLSTEDEVIPADAPRALPPAIKTMRGRNVYDPKRIKQDRVDRLL